MKKIVKSVCIVLSCVLCLCFASGCNNEPVVTTYEDAVQVLKDAGYENAYRDVYAGRGAYIYLGTDNDEKIWVGHIGNSDLFKEYNMAHSDYYNYAGFLCSDIDIETCKYDYAKTLDTVMPMVDREYKDGSYFTEQIQFKKSKYTVSYYIFHNSTDNSDTIDFEICEN